MKTRFTLTYDATSTEVEDPIGWDKLVLAMKRDKDSAGVFFEFVENTLSFIGAGLDILQTAYETDGVDAEVECLIEVNPTGLLWETITNRILVISFKGCTYDNRKFTCTIREGGTWQKLKARANQKVQLTNSLSIGGETVGTIFTHVCTVNGRNLQYVANVSQSTQTYDYVGDGTTVDTITFDTINIDEGGDADTGTSTITAPTGSDGVWQVAVAMDLTWDTGLGYASFDIYVYFSINGGFTETLFHSTADSGSTSIDWAAYPGASVSAGDVLTVIVRTVSSLGDETHFTVDNFVFETQYSSTYLATTAVGYQIGAMVSGILARILDADNLLDSLLLSTEYTQHLATTPVGDGEYSLFMFIRGLYFRGEPNRGFYAHSFKEIWDIIKKVFCLGYTITEAGVVQIAKREDFFTDEVALTLNNVDYTLEDAQDVLVNAISVGYSNYYAEDTLNSLDTFATEQQYVTPVYKIDDAAGNKLDLVANCSADHYQIEESRRNPLSGNGTTNRKYDEQLFLLSVGDESRPLDDVLYTAHNNGIFGDFDSITGIYDPDSALNLKISPKRNLLRWQKFIDPSFYRKTGQSIKYISGVANQNLVSQQTGGSSVDENASISITAPTIFVPVYINCTVPLTLAQWQIIEADAGRKKTIGVSRTTTAHIYGYVQEAKYKINEGTCVLKLIKKA